MAENLQPESDSPENPGRNLAHEFLEKVERMRNPRELARLRTGQILKALVRVIIYNIHFVILFGALHFVVDQTDWWLPPAESPFSLATLWTRKLAIILAGAGLQAFELAIFSSLCERTLESRDSLFPGDAKKWRYLQKDCIRPYRTLIIVLVVIKLADMALPHLNLLQLYIGESRLSRLVRNISPDILSYLDWAKNLGFHSITFWLVIRQLIIANFAIQTSSPSTFNLRPRNSGSFLLYRDCALRSILSLVALWTVWSLACLIVWYNYREILQPRATDSVMAGRIAYYSLISSIEECIAILPAVIWTLRWNEYNRTELRGIDSVFS